MTCWLAPGSSQNTVSRPCATPLKDRMDNHKAPRGCLTGRSLLCTKEAHTKALEEKTDHSHVSWRRARWPVRGCTSAAPSVPRAAGRGRVSHGDLGSPKESTAGPEQECCRFPERTSPRQNVPEAESQDPAGERRSHGPRHDCDQPGGEALPWDIAWPLRCCFGPDAQARGRLPRGRAAQGRL